MFTRVLAGTIAGGIVMFFAGYLVWGVLLMEYFKAQSTVYAGLMKETPDMILVASFNLAWALLYAVIFVKWAGIRTFSAGASAGAFLTVMIALVVNLQYKAFMNLYTGWTVVFVDLLASAVVGAIAGGVIGFVVGKVGATSDAETD